jgi:hypothetical protein
MNLFFIAEFLLAHLFLGIPIIGLTAWILFGIVESVDDGSCDGTATTIGLLISGFLTAYFTYPLYGPWIELYGSWNVLLIGILVYGASGALWSIFKWNRYIHSQLEYIVTQLSCGVHNVNDYINESGVINYESLPSHYKDRINPAEHKAQLLVWVFMWPISVIIYVIKFLFTDIKNAVFNLLIGTYKWMVNRALNNTRVPISTRKATDKAKL